MSERPDYALTDFTTTAASRTISSRSRISNDSFDGAPPQNPFVDQTEHRENIQPSQPYDAASGNLLSGANEQHHLHGQAFLHEWTWELAAWLVAAISLVCLIIIFAVYSDKPLRQWRADITPATTVVILSQVGQTAILAPVTACICQSMWLWLDKESRVIHQANSNGHQPRLFTMQRYDDGSRGPISSLLLLWNRPDAYDLTLLSFMEILTNNRLLVWLGTVNTLLIIIFGSFAQQSLQLPTRRFNVTNEDTNLIPRPLQYRAPQPAISQSTSTMIQIIPVTFPRISTNLLCSVLRPSSYSRNSNYLQLWIGSGPDERCHYRRVAQARY